STCVEIRGSCARSASTCEPGMSAIRIPNQRAVIDRRLLTAAVAEAVATGGSGARQKVVELLRDALEHGREEIARRLAERPSFGHEVAEAQAFLIDQLVRVRS